jgi:primosomal protein N''
MVKENEAHGGDELNSLLKKLEQKIDKIDVQVTAIKRTAESILKKVSDGDDGDGTNGDSKTTLQDAIKTFQAYLDEAKPNLVKVRDRSTKPLIRDKAGHYLEKLASDLGFLDTTKEQIDSMSDAKRKEKREEIERRNEKAKRLFSELLEE